MVKLFSQGSQPSRRKAGQRRRSRTTRSRRVKRAGSTEETERRILDAAHEVFVRAGTAGARTLEIAKEAGVNPALLHYYFRTKERLAEAVFRRAAGQLLPAVVRILGSDATLEDKVEQVVQVELQFLSKAPYLPAYILSELAHHPDRAPQLIAAVTGEVPVALGTHLRTVLAKQIDARVRDRTMHPISPDQFAVNLLALCVFPFAARPLFTALFGIDDKGFEQFIDRRRRELAPFFLRALRP
jgi:AcrR family transcriptional regulator